MASASQRKFISHKLQFLKDQKEHLINAVELYVNKIIVAGNSWTEGGHSKLEYTKLSHMIDTAVEFLCEKYEELTGGSVDDTAQQLSQSSCKQPDPTSQSAASPSSTATTSSRQSAASPSSTATTSSSQKAKPVQATDEIHSLKPVLARIAVMEEAMYSFRNNADKIAERQGDLDEQLVELLSKLSESDKKHSSRLKNFQQQISVVSDTQDAIEKEQKTSLQSLEKQLQKVSTTQVKLKVDMDSQAELVEKLVHSTKELESVKADIDGLNTKTDSSIDELNARIDNIIDDCTSNHENLETEAQDLADKVIVNTQTVKVISEGQDQNMTLLRELESRLQTMEADGGTNVKDVQKQAEKSETNFKILCKMLNDRLAPLEQLRTSLNDRASSRDDNIKKLSEVVQEIAALSPRLQQLELKSPRTSIGFSAQTFLVGSAAEGSTITHYKIKHSNVGQDFNAASGIFTAPDDGLYVAAISLCLSESEELQVGVRYKQGPGQSIGIPVCESSAEVKGTTACGVGVVQMKAGHILLSSVFHIDNNDSLKVVFWSCFRLG